MTVSIQCTKWVVVLPAEQEAAAAALALILTAGADRPPTRRNP